MPTIKQLIRNKRQPIRNVTKSPALRGCPQRRGTYTRVMSFDKFRRDLEKTKWIPMGLEKNDVMGLEENEVCERNVEWY
uniref:Ribosomal protein S12 n=1 Tax=Kalanchoe fedtschenkoi TaxID=63787 RepID=A0A7N0THQ5_KALFE